MYHTVDNCDFYLLLELMNVKKTFICYKM